MSRETRSGSATQSLRRLAEWIPVVSGPRLWDLARSAFWIVPALSVLVSIGMAVGMVALDRHFGQIHTFFVYPGPPGGARSFLSSIVTSMITVTGTVFSVSVLVLQLTNTQFSSRAIPMYLRDLTAQATMGLFMATFVYALVVQRSVGGNGASGFVPRLAVSVAFLFVLASVGLFIHYISHISNLVRVAAIVRTLSDQSRRLLDQRYPADTPPQRPAPDLPGKSAVIEARQPGVLVSVNARRLLEIATEYDCVLVVAARVGDFVPGGAALCRIHRDGAPPADGAESRRSLEEKVVRAVAQDAERTMEQDLAFGFRQLVDIAEKALSPSLNDPTTATQCLDSIHDLLRRLVGRHLPDGQYRHDDGRVRVVVPQYSFEDFLDLGLTEIWRYGRDSPQIPPRLATMLADLEKAARPEYRGALRGWAARIGE